MENKPIRIILVDDHRRVHQVMVEMFSFFDGIELIAQGNNGQEAIALCDRYQPDILLMDVVMPIMDGVEATKHIIAKHPNIKILALSSFKDNDTVRTMLQNGAVGYILKDSSVDDLENTIHTVYEGQGVLSPEIMQALMQESESPTQPTYNLNLSARELEILKHFADGKTNNQIAVALSISISTVKFHIANIITKLGVETRAEALVIAAKNNLV